MPNQHLARITKKLEVHRFREKRQMLQNIYISP